MTGSTAAGARAESGSGTAVLAVRDVTVRVQARTLLQGIGFDVRAGEVVAILGPNGAGKTTLLEVVAGLRACDSGVVAFHGAAAERFSERARLIAFLPDEGRFPAELVADEVVAHALRFRPRGRQLVDELRAMLAIDAILDVPAGVLSRGEHQRVALFCALAVDRPVVVLDEPFGAFDPLKLRDVLRAVRRVADSGAAIVATVHHLADAAKVADRVLVLDEGRVVAFGALDALRARVGLPDGALEDVFVALLSGSAHGS